MARHLRFLTAALWPLGLVLFVTFVPVAGAQSPRIPNGELAVAYRQLKDGTLSDAVFQNWLECSEGRCALTTLTLGQCVAGAWYPKVQRWTTAQGDLAVALAGPGRRSCGNQGGWSGPSTQVRIRGGGLARRIRIAHRRIGKHYGGRFNRSMQQFPRV